MPSGVTWNRPARVAEPGCWHTDKTPHTQSPKTMTRKNFISPSHSVATRQVPEEANTSRARASVIPKSQRSVRQGCFYRQCEVHRSQLLPDLPLGSMEGGILAAPDHLKLRSIRRPGALSSNCTQSRLGQMNDRAKPAPARREGVPPRGTPGHAHLDTSPSKDIYRSRTVEWLPCGRSGVIRSSSRGGNE